MLEELEGAEYQFCFLFTARRTDSPSHSPFVLSKTQPAFDETAVVDPFWTRPLESHTPVLESIETHSPLSRTSGVLHARQPDVPVAKHESQSGLQSTQVDVAELKNVRAAHLTKVPFESAVVAVMHLVASVGEAWRAP